MLTLKPAGACSCALFGLADTVALFLTDGVANGSGSFGSWAAPVAQKATENIKREVTICFVLIICSPEVERVRCSAGPSTRFHHITAPVMKSTSGRSPSTV